MSARRLVVAGTVMGIAAMGAMPGLAEAKNKPFITLTSPAKVTTSNGETGKNVYWRAKIVGRAKHKDDTVEIWVDKKKCIKKTQDEFNKHPGADRILLKDAGEGKFSFKSPKQAAPYDPGKVHVCGYLSESGPGLFDLTTYKFKTHPLEFVAPAAR
jgi:hypothetical protein